MDRESRAIHLDHAVHFHVTALAGFHGARQGNEHAEARLAIAIREGEFAVRGIGVRSHEEQSARARAIADGNER